MGFSMLVDNYQRCNNSTKGITIMSMFNEQVICTICKIKERQHAEYDNAVAIELIQVVQGNLNFKGIGLPQGL